MVGSLEPPPHSGIWPSQEQSALLLLLSYFFGCDIIKYKMDIRKWFTNKSCSPDEDGHSAGAATLQESATSRGFRFQ